MATVADVCDFLETFAPSKLAAEWDNVGLLVGNRGQPVERLMTCLTITPAVCKEAIRERVDLIVTHHPLPFRPLKRLTSDEPTGRILLELIRAGIGIHSPHTSFDSAAAGINQQLAEGLGLVEIRPLIESDTGSAVGAGRYGRLPQQQTLLHVAAQLKQFLNIPGLQRVGDPQQPIERVAVGCGSAGEFLTEAARLGCELL